MLIRSTPNDVDVLARRIAELAAVAAAMPPAYKSHGIREPVMSQGGKYLGHILDGKGLYLDTDLKSLGIKKRIPHVYERSLTQAILDKLGDERGFITTYDGIIAARAAGNMSDWMMSKASFTTVANAWCSDFRSTGIPTTGTYTNIPNGAAMDKTNVGALSLGLTNPTSGTDYLLTFGMVSAQQINMVMLVDLLVCAGNISATSAVAQTITSVALTRYTTGAGVNMTFEVTTQLGASASSITVSYTNQAGTAGQSTGAIAMTTSCIVQRLQPAAIGPMITLQSGDSGVRAVATVTLSATMAAGVFALNIYKPLLFMPGVVANVYAERDTTTTIDGLMQLPVDSTPNIGCLAAYLLPNTTTTGVKTQTIRTCWG